MSENSNRYQDDSADSVSPEEQTVPGRRKFLQLAAGSSALGVLAGSVGAGALGLTSTPAEAARNGNPLNLYTQPFPVRGFAAKSAGAPLTPYAFRRRAVGPNDVAIDLHYCGVCHSDIHTSNGDWGPQPFPLVTGHELAGVVVAVGSGVSEFRVGDRVGVGCMVNSCGVCHECSAGFEQYCEVGTTMTYGTRVDESVEPTGITQGGYSTAAVINKDFVIRIPKEYDLAAAGPVMCAAVTVYSPFRHWQIRKGSTIGIIGLGGLGHLGVKIAKALGAEVIVFTTSPAKEADAKRFGAADVIVNNNAEKIKAYTRKLDFILDTSPEEHNLDAAITTLKRDATLCRVGIGNVKMSNQIGQFGTIVKRNSFAGSLIGSIRETQEVIDFCNLHNIKPDYQLIKPSEINQVWENVINKKARYRYVMDIKSM